MAIDDRVAAGKITASTGTNTGVVIPVTVQASDTMVAFATYSGSATLAGTGAGGAPPGWTILLGPITKGTALTAYVLIKVAGSGDAGSTVPFDWSSTAAIRNTEISVYSGADTTTPVLDKASFVETAAGLTHVSPAVSRAGVAGCWAIEFYADRGSPSSSTTPTGAGLTTRNSDIGSGGGSITSAVADANTAITGANGGGTTWTGQLSTANVILATVILQPAVLSAPAGLTTTPVSSSRIDLSWTAFPGATGYDIERNGVVVGSTATTSYSDTGLSPLTTYGYRVRSTN